jgi:hypothetical protein
MQVGAVYRTRNQSFNLIINFTGARAHAQK